MKVLVTGSNGFIGKNMLGWLQQQEEIWYVEGWDWHPIERPDVSSFNWVIHLGANTDKTDNDIEAVLRQNLDFSRWLFEECNKHGVHLQYASSFDVYGITKNFSETAPAKPASAYAWSKYLFDRWVFQQPQKIYVQGFRYFNVYGRYDKASVIHTMREQARRENKIQVWEGAEYYKQDWVWVGDVCKLHIDFIKAVHGSGLWNVGSGLAHSLLDIAEELAVVEDCPIEIVPVSDELKQKIRSKTVADLKFLKQTIGPRKWLNLFEYLNQ
jgi:ADP-L-glycero-D-manno-heptose 6-epimerase